MEIEHFEGKNSKQLTKEEHKSVMEVQEEKKNLVLCSYFERYKKAKHQFDIINKSLKDVRNWLLRCKVTAKELERMYLEHTGKQIKIKLSTYLQLDMKVKENNDIINELNGRELPKIWGVRISNVADSIHIVNNFLKESIPQNLKYIQFNFDSSTEADCENFVDSLWYAARKVTTKVSIYNTNLSSTHFWRILCAFSHWIDVGFYNCIILIKILLY